MLDQKMTNILNKQIVIESAASSKYLAMAVWCEAESLEGCAAFLYRQADEEREHMLKLVHYINDSDSVAIIPAVAAPPAEYESIQALFEAVHEGEQAVTAAINQIVSLCYEINDHATLSFMQWYIEEQREEEALMRSIIDKINLIGDGWQEPIFI
ncbi:MAG: ferritin [Bacteroidota bacterium]